MQKGKIMIKKKFFIFLLIITIFIGIFFSILSKIELTNEMTYSPETFHETLMEPDSFSIVDYSMRAEGLSHKMSREERHDMAVVVSDDEVIKTVTNILNDKNLKTVHPSEFDRLYENADNKIRFHIQTAVNGYNSSEYYYPYNIYILNDNTLYVQVAKNAKYQYLKSFIDNDEFEYIYNLSL